MLAEKAPISVVVNASTLEQVASVGSTLELPGSVASGGSAVAVNPATNTVYEADDNGTVIVVDGNTNTISARVHVGEFPDAIAVRLQDKHRLRCEPGFEVCVGHQWSDQSGSRYDSGWV